MRTSGPRLQPHLAEQTLGFRPGDDTTPGKLIIVQYWTGFAAGQHGPHGPRHALIVSVNDTVTGERVGGAAQVRGWYTANTSGLARYVVTEDQARDMLADAGHQPRACTSCAERLPLGGRFCRICGLPYGGLPRRSVAQSADMFRRVTASTVSTVST